MILCITLRRLTYILAFAQVVLEFLLVVHPEYPVPVRFLLATHEFILKTQVHQTPPRPTGSTSWVKLVVFQLHHADGCARPVCLQAKIWPIVFQHGMPVKLQLVRLMVRNNTFRINQLQESQCIFLASLTTWNLALCRRLPDTHHRTQAMAAAHSPATTGSLALHHQASSGTLPSDARPARPLV